MDFKFFENTTKITWQLSHLLQRPWSGQPSSLMFPWNMLAEEKGHNEVIQEKVALFHLISASLSTAHKFFHYQQQTHTPSPPLKIHLWQQLTHVVPPSLRSGATHKGKLYGFIPDDSHNCTESLHKFLSQKWDEAGHQILTPWKLFTPLIHKVKAENSAELKSWGNFLQDAFKNVEFLIGNTFHLISSWTSGSQSCSWLKLRFFSA